VTALVGRPAPAGLEDVAGHLDREAERWIEILREFIRHPSRTGELAEVRSCAEWIAGVLRGAGLEPDLVDPGHGAPIVLARRDGPPGAPHLLLYSHYDVISPEPVSGWTHPPFEAVRDGGRIYGRGSTDAKANVLAIVGAAAAFGEVRGSVPCGLTVILDGEEEAGSNNLPEFVELARDRLRADAVVSFDGAIDPSGRPKIGLGTSGMLFVELHVRGGASRELHSAAARLFPNPAWRLVWALASIKSPDESVGIAGFDDPIRAASDDDRRLMAAMGWDGEVQRRESGVDGFLLGLEGDAALERLLFQPGLALAGIEAGYTGPGMKAVIPSGASAKLEFRIVPDQEPETVLAQLRAHLDRHGFTDVEIETLATVETARTDPGDPLVEVLASAARDVYGDVMIKPTEEYAGRQGAWLGRRLGIPGAQTGIGPPGARGHATDEFVTEEHYLAGIRYAAALMERYGRQPRQPGA
jgi:acetylornithine deacetylase/succinyl-diaminopimelate desuccinylase-like protein